MIQHDQKLQSKGSFPLQLYNDVIILNTFQVDLQVLRFYPVISGHKNLLLQEASYFPEKKVDSAT